MNGAKFVSELKAVDFPDTFNPYSSRCPVYDRAEAPKERSLTLTLMLQAAEKVEIDSVWIGRDLGYRGGRRTGLALTDDLHMHKHAERWGIEVARPTNGTPVAERTAAVIWGILDTISAPVFLWNVFPLHPHEPADPFTNRAHNSKERDAGEAVLCELLAILCPKRVIAVGNDASKSAQRIGCGAEVVPVRHPSYGGQNDFLRQIRSLYDCRQRLLI